MTRSTEISATVRKVACRLSLSVLAFAVFACAGAAPAQAARVRPLLNTLSFDTPRNTYGIAVNQSTHHFYVANRIPSTPEVIFNYEGNGQLDPIRPVLTGGLEAPRFVAVDNSGGPYAGFIYGSSLFYGVQQYDPSGQATSVEITAGDLPANGTAQQGGLPPVVNKGTFTPRAIAVDGSGDVFVSDASVEGIDVFDPTGAFVKQIGVGQAPFLFGLAVTAAGNILAASGLSPQPGKPGGLYELDSSGDCLKIGCAPIDPHVVNGGMAFDQSTGTVVASSSVFTTGEIREYDLATEALIGVTRAPQIQVPGGVGIQEATGELIVDDESEGGSVQIYGPVEVVPDVETLPPTEVGSQTATLEGEIGAAGVAGATCVFQYVTAEEFNASRFEEAAEVPCQPAGPFSGEAMNAVHAEVVGLQGGTTYHERILGTNGNGSNPGDDVTVETTGSTISGSEVAEVSEAAATLKATVDPNGSATTYRFQYLSQTQFEASGWSGAIEVPAGGESIGEGTEPVPIAQRIEALAPGVAYRFRTLAVSNGGESIGKEVGFATYAPPGPAGLPDGRRYEQASPRGKNGSNAQGGIDAVGAAPDGHAITFFVNTGVPGGEGSQEFPIFLAARAADGSGWSTQGLLPPGSYGVIGHVLGWSEDLADTYDYAGPTSGVAALLRRDNADGSLSPFGTIEAGNNPFALAASSTGGAVAVLESLAGGLLPEDLAGKQNVYAYGREANELVVAGVMNDGSVPPGGAMAGPYAWFGGSLSVAGGALSHTYTQAEHVISADGSEVFFTAGGTRQLYVRLNPLAPQSAMSGEECTEAAKACTVRISAPEQGVTDPGTPAAFLGASADGNLVYFLDKGKLTADATGGTGYDLYRYDLGTGGLTDLTLDTVDNKGAHVEGMLGMGESGQDAYFVAAGKLSAGARQAPLGETNLYVLRGTAIEFITRLQSNVAGTVGESFLWNPVSNEFAPHESRVSADGQTLLLRSRRQLTGYNNQSTRCSPNENTPTGGGPCSELFLYQVGKGISCISCNPTGQPPAAKSGLQEIQPGGVSLRRGYSFMTRNLSADGRRVIFDSRDRLLVADRNNVNDVYEWEEKGKGSCNEEAVAGGCLFLISSGAENASASWFGDADEEGENVFLFTAQPLVAQDKDELFDVYDARVGGGIASQEAEPSVPCESPAGCRSAAASPPKGSEPATQSFSGPGNSKPAGRKPCKRGFVRRHGKCVRKHNQGRKKNGRGQQRGNGGGR